jgi:hypothetical protein
VINFSDRFNIVIVNRHGQRTLDRLDGDYQCAAAIASRKEPFFRRREGSPASLASRESQTDPLQDSRVVLSVKTLPNTANDMMENSARRQNTESQFHRPCRNCARTSSRLKAHPIGLSMNRDMFCETVLPISTESGLRPRNCNRILIWPSRSGNEEPPYFGCSKAGLVDVNGWVTVSQGAGKEPPVENSQTHLVSFRHRRHL